MTRNRRTPVLRSGARGMIGAMSMSGLRQLSTALGLPHKDTDLKERAALLVDHLLYGVVVAASPWPHQDR
ncbi:hypothetical protein [Nonomuraea rhizosphaerae]|uniref:hypothetical protein n=1 Tax=Nonomuraea rhizosphaerae TaxID=2665663 RepID=UPI001C5D98DA|nr:hypothetical protein [Nonomuraea rhizosphaerae]